MPILLLQAGAAHAAVQYGVYGGSGLYPDPLSACVAYPIIPTAEHYVIDGYMVVNGNMYCSGHGDHYVGHYSNIQVFTTGECEAGKSVDPATGQCTPSYPRNSTYDAATETWTCKPGYASKGGRVHPVLPYQRIAYALGGGGGRNHRTDAADRLFQENTEQRLHIHQRDEARDAVALLGLWKRVLGCFLESSRQSAMPAQHHH
ncbi:hypothetical protein [Ramlibacter sp.]|uniref:hypothetical protein n=1 Tax=Ramlibacter sp. TaxID=1917967 RepID=UPI00181EEC5E|nr:hypothetical protein [Ramlibacter sp.]MBA2675750.1 hypothetical protein [Ramlibacter sp.]